MVRPSVALAVVVLVLLAGCGGNREPDPITDSAAAVSVDDDALTAAGYAKLSTDRPRFTTSGQATISGDVQMDLRYQFNATTRRAVYATERAPPGVFAVWAVPLIEPEDVALTVDPLRDLGPTSLATRAQNRYREITSVEPAREGNSTVSLLGTEVTVARYTATATVDGSTTEVRLAVASTAHNGDVVVAVSITPSTNDAETTRQLFTGIRH